MKIVFVCDTLGPGGAERVISSLSNELIKRGHDVSILMLSKGAEKPFYDLAKDINLIYLTRDINHKLSFFKKAKILRNCLENSKPDMVISFLSYVCIYTWWALRKTKTPYIVSERNDPHQRSKFKQFLLNLAFKKASGCVFQTEDAYKWYERIAKNKATIIYNPVNPVFKPATIKERKNQVLYVGRFNEQKNIFMLIDAFKIFLNNNPDYILKMYGDGSLKLSIIEYIKSASLEKKVSIVPSSDKWQMNECDSKLFVLPSKFEGMPNVLAEALCLGIPSISTDCPIGGPKELKKLFPSTLILSSDMSPVGFAHAMEDGLKIVANKTEIPNELNIQKITDRWIDFINQVKYK